VVRFEAAGITVGVGIVLTEMFELANVELADQGRHVLIVFVSGLRLGNADLPELVRIEFCNGEFGNVAVEFIEPLDGPWRHQTCQQAFGNIVLVGEQIAHAFRVEQADRRFENRADLVAGFQNIDRLVLHQPFQDFRHRRLAAPDRSEQVENLFAFFQTLRRMPEKADDAFDRLFHAVEVGESGVAFDRAIEEYAAQALVLAGIDQFRLSDRRDHSFGCGRPHARIIAAGQQIILQGDLFHLGTVIDFGL